MCALNSRFYLNHSSQFIFDQVASSRFRRQCIFRTRVRVLLEVTQPHNTRWLDAAERRLAQVRLAEDAGEADKDADNLTYV